MPSKNYLCKINLKLLYLPPYDRLFWDYSEAGFTNIGKRRSQNNCNALKDLKRLIMKLNTKYWIMNIFSIFFPIKTITYRDKKPPCLTDDMTKLCNKKVKMFKHYVKKGFSDADKVKFIRSTNLSSAAITEANKAYFFFR